MSSTKQLFDREQQDAYAWLKSINQHALWPIDNYSRALAALKAVLQTFRDCVTVATSAHFSAQLPTLIRGWYFERWDFHEPVAMHARTQSQFLETIQHKLAKFPEIDPKAALFAVISVIEEKVGSSAIDKLATNLSKEVTNLWQMIID